MERRGLPSLESAIENLDSLLEEMAKTGGSSHSRQSVQDEGLETELDRLTSRLVSAMANRDSIEEAATRGSWSLDFKLTRAGSILSASLATNAHSL